MKDLMELSLLMPANAAKYYTDLLELLDTRATATATDTRATATATDTRDTAAATVNL